MPDRHVMSQVMIDVVKGKPIAEIAREHGVPPATVLRWIEQEEASREVSRSQADLRIEGPGSWVGRRKPLAAKYPNTPSRQRKRRKK